MDNLIVPIDAAVRSTLEQLAEATRREGEAEEGAECLANLAKRHSRPMTQGDGRGLGTGPQLRTGRANGRGGL